MGSSFFLRLYTQLFSSLPFLFPSPLLPILHFQLSLLLSHVPSILRLLLLLLFSSFSYVLPFSFAAAPSTFFLRLLFQRLPQRFSEMMVFSSLLSSSHYCGNTT